MQPLNLFFRNVRIAQVQSLSPWGNDQAWNNPDNLIFIFPTHDYTPLPEPAGVSGMLPV